ncbi:A-kinase anchor 10, mitochondrial, partial [Paramuricea clavata]
LPRKDLFKAGHRPANSSAKCVANFPRRSRLSKSLPEVLVDSSILPLFLEFLYKQGAQNVLNFWLSAETFRLSSRDKNVSSYKSRLKLTTKQDLTGSTDIFNMQNSSRLGIPAFQMERHDNSSETSLQNSRSFSSAGTNDDSSTSFKSGNEGLRTQANIPCVMSQSKLEVSEAMQTSPDCTTENASSYDSSRKDVSSPLIYNSMNSNLTLPNLNEDNGARLGSISPISAGHSTCTDASALVVSPLSTSSIDQSEEKSCESCNSDISDETSFDTSECSAVPFTSELQAEGNMVSASPNELSCADKSRGDGSASEIFHPQVQLIRQESSDTRERRRMSKVMMDDAVSIYRHFISLDATQPLGVDENMRREVESNICTENGIIDPDCFKVAQKFAFNTLQNRYFDDFIRSSYYHKHIMDILTSGKVFLADIMYNDNAMFYFMEFIEQEEKSYLLAFWIAVDSFWQELQSKLDSKEYNADEALDDAMVLYDKYFSMQASNSLGVSDETRIRIENKICREGGPLPDCFEEPMENVLTLLEEVYFPIFLDSSVYMKYLNELFSSVTDVDSDRTSTCADDCSSTASTSETSKLMESLVNDVEPLEDPDEIWQRPHFG